MTSAHIPIKLFTTWIGYRQISFPEKDLKTQQLTGNTKTMHTIVVRPENFNPMYPNLEFLVNDNFMPLPNLEKNNKAYKDQKVVLSGYLTKFQRDIRVTITQVELEE